MTLNKIEDWDNILDQLENTSLISKEEFSIKSLNRNEATACALANNEWHNKTLQLTASYVRMGLNDNEIHRLTNHLTLEGYKTEETKAEVQKMIDGAREKNFGPSNKDHKEPLLQHIANIELKPTEWLVENLIEKGSLSQIFGESGSGKSFVAIDLSCAIASGKDFQGHAVVNGPVIYIAGEGRNGSIRRMGAWAKKYSLKLSDINIYVSRTAVGIQNDTELANLKNHLAELVMEFGYPNLIVLDTLARNFGNANENDTKDMSNFVAELDHLKDEFNCTILIVHHSGHKDNKRGRGSSVLYGALDSEYNVTKIDDRIKMRCTKMKDDTEPDPMHFYLVPEKAGQEKNGTPIISAVLEYRGEGVTESVRLTTSEKLAVRSFHEAVAELNQSSLNLNPSNVELEKWKDKYYKNATQENRDSKRKAFNRARLSLVNKGIFSVEHDIYTLIKQDIGTCP